MASSSVVVVINLCLKLGLAELSNKEGHHTVARQAKALAMKIFFSQTLNTALVVLLINSARYSVFESTWYNDVGASIVTTMLINSLVPALLAAREVGQQLLKQLWARMRAVTQSQLLAAYTGPNFKIAPRYGEVFMLVFVCVVYSSGMPLLLWVAAFSVFVKYWTDKWMLLRVNRRPPRYGTSMASTSVNLGLAAVVVHLFVGAYAHSFAVATSFDNLQTLFSDDLVPFVNAYASNSTLSQVIVEALVGERGLGERVIQRNVAPLVALAFTLLVVLLFRAFFRKLFKILVKAVPFFRRFFYKWIQNKVAEGNPPFQTALDQNLFSGLATYNITDNPYYRTAVESMLQLRETNSPSPDPRGSRLLESHTTQQSPTAAAAAAGTPGQPLSKQGDRPSETMLIDHSSDEEPHGDQPANGDTPGESKVRSGGSGSDGTASQNNNVDRACSNNGSSGNNNDDDDDSTNKDNTGSNNS